MPLALFACYACYEAGTLSIAHTAHESAACRYMAVPWTHFVFADGGVVAAVLAVVLHLRRFAAGRGGGNRSGAAGAVSTGFAVVAALMVLPDLYMAVTTHLTAAHTASLLGHTMCEG